MIRRSTQSLAERLDAGEEWVDLLREAVARHESVTAAAVVANPDIKPRSARVQLHQWLAGHHKPGRDRQRALLTRLG